MNRLRLSTVLWGTLAVGALALALADPWRPDDASSALVSVRSDSRRVFPGLGDYAMSRANIELQPSAGPVVRLVGAPDGHRVMRGDELIGLVDPEAFDGVWASLRMATTVRAVDRGVDVRPGRRGTIRVTVSDRTFTVSLGDDTADGSGIYAEVGEGSERESWVVESELGWLVDQPAEAWVSRRLVHVEPEDVTALAWDEQLVLGRGEDGIWRVVSGASPAVLSNDAVDARLERLLSTRLDPLLPRDGLEVEEWTPWLVISTGPDGRNHALVLGGNCPSGGDKQQLVDRGPGLVGCIPTSLTEPWAVADPEAAMIESQLVPYDYGRVLAVELITPDRRSLRRRSGGWEVREGESAPAEVSEAEVYRWYTSLRTLEIDPEVEPLGVDVDPAVAVDIDTDSTQRMRIECGEVEGRRYCRRDAGPFRAIVGGANIGPFFDVETFRDRRLLHLAAGDAVAIEIRPGVRSPGRAAPPRFSAHLDAGVWRLDAPPHPEGDAALDDVKFERLLATLGALRAEAWTRVPTGAAPVATIHVDRAPGTGRDPTVELELFEGCIARVDGGRPGQLSDAACRTLVADLLYDDPLRAWLGTARSVDVSASDGRKIVLRRTATGWVDPGGRADMPEAELLRGLEDWRSAGVVQGQPPGEAEHSLLIRRNEGTDVKVELGPNWARIVRPEIDWYYRASPRMTPPPDQPEPAPALDPE